MDLIMTTTQMIDDLATELAAGDEKLTQLACRFWQCNIAQVTPRGLWIAGPMKGHYPDDAAIGDFVYWVEVTRHGQVPA